MLNLYGIRFTTADLAMELGVSKRSLYEHFDSKNDIIAAVFDEILRGLESEITAITLDGNLDTVEKLKALMEIWPKAVGPFSALAVENTRRLLPGEWLKFERYFQRKWDIVDQVVSQGIAAGQLRGVNTAVLRRLYMGGIDQLLDYEFLNDNNLTFKTAIAMMTEVLINGLAIAAASDPAEK